MKKTSAAEYTESLRLYEELVATNPAIERKGAAVPYTSVNGHMFSYLSKSGELALRLPADVLQVFLKKYKTSLCQQYGVVQKEYAMVPNKLLQKTKELKRYFDLSYEYVSSLRPKPSKRGKA